MYNKYSDKIGLNKRKLINNKNKSNLNDDYNNYFLKEEDLELPTFQKNNYQSQFINKKLFISNTKKNKNKYISNFEHYNKEEKKTKENNYYSNNSNIRKNIENYFNNDSLSENFEHLKKINNNINDILSNMEKEIRSSSRKKSVETKKSNEDKVFVKLNNTAMRFNKSNQYKNSINKSDNINEIDFNLREQEFNKFKINDSIKINNFPKKNFIIDKNQQNQINIQGIKQKKVSKKHIEISEFTKDKENKLNSIYGKNKIKIVNIDKLINDLYEYKIRHEKLKFILKFKNIEKNKKEKNDNLSKLKEEGYKLKMQKKFLINELTKSIYNTENLRSKYKNELERFDSYLNKIKFDLKEKKIDNF